MCSISLYTTYPKQLTNPEKSSRPPDLSCEDRLRNLITDVPGLTVGNAEDLRLGSGATAIIFDEPATASVDVRGGGPGTRETDLLDPERTVPGIDAIVLSGGSGLRA